MDKELGHISSPDSLRGLFDIANDKVFIFIDFTVENLPYGFGQNSPDLHIQVVQQFGQAFFIFIIDLVHFTHKGFTMVQDFLNTF